MFPFPVDEQTKAYLTTNTRYNWVKTTLGGTAYNNNEFRQFQTITA